MSEPTPILAPIQIPSAFVNPEPSINMCMEAPFEFDPSEIDLLDLFRDCAEYTNEVPVQNNPALVLSSRDIMAKTQDQTMATMMQAKVPKTEEFSTSCDLGVSQLQPMNAAAGGRFDQALAERLQAQLVQNGLPADIWQCLHPPGKPAKTQAEIDEAIERIKKKRRESAQRSRARKSAYVKALELENKLLKDEVMKLRLALSQATKMEEYVAEASSSGSGSHVQQHFANPYFNFETLNA